MKAPWRDVGSVVLDDASDKSKNSKGGLQPTRRLLNVGNHQPNKKAPTELEKNICLINGWHPQHKRNSSTSVAKKKKKIQLKNECRTWTDIFPKKTYKGWIDEYIQRYQTSLIIRWMKIKSTVKLHPRACWFGCYQHKREGGYTCALLVGMQTGAASMETSMKVPRKVKNWTRMIQQSHSWVCIWRR